MRSDMISDFVVDSKGRCFFCLNKLQEINLELESVPHPLGSYEVIQFPRCLSRYLKMDMGKVFKVKEQSPPHLVTGVENSQLKVQACDNCAQLTDQFLKLYQKLEKLKMEVGSCLSLIQGKLLEGEETRKTELFKQTIKEDSNLNLSSGGVLEVVDALRNEAVHKCFKKLRALSPRVNVQDLRQKEIKMEKLKYHPPLSTVKEEQDAYPLVSSIHHFPHSGLGKSDMKMEPESHTMYDDDTNYFSDHLNFDIEALVKSNSDRVAGSTGGGDVVTEIKALTPKLLGSRSSNNVAKYQITGELKCSICNKEFCNHGRGAQAHYKSAHLKVRFNCVCCNKLFAYQSSLRKHQQAANCGEGPTRRFNCHLCGKSFSRKAHLDAHLDGVHFKLLKYICNICGAKFNIKPSLCRHRRKAHFGGN